MRKFIACFASWIFFLSCSAFADDDAGMAAFRKKDFVTALAEWRASAEHGDVRAMASVGVLYANGLGVERDDAEALRWFHAAADKGDANGEYNMGVMYRDGRGVAKDDTEAVHWFCWRPIKATRMPR
jgi:TPR repeat protein